MSTLTMHRRIGEMSSPSVTTQRPSHLTTVADIFRRWSRAMAKRRARNKAAASLMALDDRMLKDIGIDRSEIFSVLTEEALPTELRHRRSSLFE